MYAHRSVGRMSAPIHHPGYVDDQVQLLMEKLPCRETQVGTLLALMGEVRVTKRDRS